MGRTENTCSTSSAIAHAKSAKDVATTGHTMRPAIDRQNVPMRKQIEDYAQKEEERYNQIATYQKNTHTFARLASQLGEWEEKIDGKGK